MYSMLNFPDRRFRSYTVRTQQRLYGTGTLFQKNYEIWAVKLRRYNVFLITLLEKIRLPLTVVFTG
jgi:hypothetical protein